MCRYTRAGKSEGRERLRQKVQDIFAMYCTVLYCTFPGYSIPSPPHLDDLQIILIVLTDHLFYTYIWLRNSTHDYIE